MGSLLIIFNNEPADFRRRKNVEIKLESVIKRVVNGHYDNIDWRTIDALGEHDIPRIYGVQSFIKYDEFRDTLQAGGFINSRDTVASKWRALTGDNTLILQRGRKEKVAFIDLRAVKMMVSEWNRIAFDPTVYEQITAEDVRVRSACVTANQGTIA